jgi:hypothetical protein
LKAIRKPNLLDVEILLRELQLVSQGHLLERGDLKGVSQKIAQSRDCRHGSIISTLTNKSGDGIQGVEQKVRFNLAAKGIQLRHDELLVESSGLSLLVRQSRSRLHEITYRHNAGVQHEG